MTVSASELSTVSMPATKRKHLPEYPIPILRLARLAVAESAQGQGAGRLLVRTVLALAQQMAVSVCCVGVVVDAKPEAAAFYRKLGFVPLDVVGGELGDRPVPQVMFLELGQVPAAT
jgi:GNAT superfamily N-acetyltransferase